MTNSPLTSSLFGAPQLDRHLRQLHAAAHVAATGEIGDQVAAIIGRVDQLAIVPKGQRCLLLIDLLTGPKRAWYG